MESEILWIGDYFGPNRTHVIFAQWGVYFYPTPAVSLCFVAATSCGRISLCVFSRIWLSPLFHRSRTILMARANHKRLIGVLHFTDLESLVACFKILRQVLIFVFPKSHFYFFSFLFRFLQFGVTPVDDFFSLDANYIYQ